MKIRIDHVVIESKPQHFPSKPYHTRVTSTIDGIGPITHHFWTKKILSLKSIIKKIKRERGEK